MIQKLISAGAILLNGQKTRSSRVISQGDMILICRPEMAAPNSMASLNPVRMDLDILWEDEYLLVVNKPAGLMVHPGAGQHGPTLAEGLLYHCKGLLPGGGTRSQRPGIVHRLDKGTTGSLVCAKNEAVHRHLAEQFKKKTNRREYLALLNGSLNHGIGSVESYLYRDPGNRLKYASMAPKEYQGLAKANRAKGYRFARSHFEKLADFGHRLSLARVRLETGRTHQIRVHAASLSCPLLGDPLYGLAGELPAYFDARVRGLIARLRRQMLHAEILGFVHPVSQKYMEFKAPLPADFSEVLGNLRPYRIDDHSGKISDES